MTDFLENGTNDPSHLILLLNKPNLAEYISADVNLRTKLLNICSETLQNNPSDERVILNLLRFAKEMAALSSLENLQSFLGYVKDTLGRYLGVADEVKMSCCDLMSVICVKCRDLKKEEGLSTRSVKYI